MSDGETALHTQLTNLQINSSITSQIESLNDLSLKEVSLLKGLIENDLDKNFQVLSSQNLDMDSSLITQDGYPRSDIDVLQVRLTRKNINMLRNDLHNVIERSHFLLNQHFTLQKQQRPQGNEDHPLEFTIPFASITEIVSDGPIAKAGIQSNDKLISIGNIHAGNHMKLQNVQRLIIQNEDNIIPVRILRNDKDIMQLSLEPTRNWKGHGLLGCKLQLL